VTAVGGAPAVPTLRPGPLTSLRLAWLFSRPAPQALSVLLLPIATFAVVTALLLLVIGGTRVFWSWTDEDAFVYQLLSVIALVLLVVPLANLGGAAARLSARRRDDRLATLRLLGATPKTVAVITILEATAIAVAGALAGIVLSLIGLPFVGLIPFRGEPLGAAALLLDVPVVALVILGMALLAAVSAAVGLRGVIISPLGVRTRRAAPRQHWARALISVAAIAAAFLLMNLLQLAGSAIVLIVILGAGFGGSLAVLNLVGPWLLGVFGRRQARKAATPARLLAARSILESPKAAWRQVSGVAMTSFMAVFAGTGLALAELGSGSSNGDESSKLLLADVRTGVAITVIASFLMVACSVVVNQLSNILDQRALYVSLDRLGMPRATMEAARVRAVLFPLCFVSIGSALVAAVVVFPLTGLAILLAPLSVLVIALILAGGIALVYLALRLTRPGLTSVLAHPERG
jgi:hypothetical protein